MDDINAQSNNTDQTNKTPTPESTPKIPQDVAAPVVATPNETPVPASDTVTAVPAATEPGKSSVDTPNKSSMKKLVIMLMPVLAIILIIVAGLGGYKASTQKADKKIAALNSQLSMLQTNEHDLPEGAVKVSECVPNMGYHYATKTSDKEYGPFLLVTKKNKVVGVEYMVSKEMYTAIPKTNPPVELVTKESPMYGWKFDHTEIDHLPKGHEGLLVDHVDVHIYTVSKAQQKLACVQ